MKKKENQTFENSQGTFQMGFMTIYYGNNDQGVARVEIGIDFPWIRICFKDGTERLIKRFSPNYYDDDI